MNVGKPLKKIADHKLLLLLSLLLLLLLMLFHSGQKGP